MALNSGDLNRRITIQVGTDAKDSYGQPFIAWHDLCTAWASIKTPTSKEIYALGPGFTSQVTHKILIRYRSGITSAMRVAYAGRIFAIQTVFDPDEGREQLTLMCLEIDGGR